MALLPVVIIATPLQPIGLNGNFNRFFLSGFSKLMNVLDCIELFKTKKPDDFYIRLFVLIM